MDVKRAVAGKTGEKRERQTNPRRRGLVRGRPHDAALTVFVHIPKTAGTTFMAVLRDNYPGGGVGSVGNSFKGNGGFETGPMMRLRDAPIQRTRDMHVLTGHLPFAIRDVLPEGTRYVTFLRDPVERTLSQYYGLLKLSRRNPLPGDGSLEAVLAEGNIIYDNLQTRMLSGDPEPVGEIDEESLEQAKENLRRDFVAFGIVERFDESLVLIKRALDLRSITYVQQRVTTRPRGSEVPEEALRLVKEINNYDDELYRWAREHFEHRVAEQGVDFAADVAAVDVARTGAAPSPPPAAAAEDPAAMWDLLVRARADLFVDRRARVEAALASRSDLRGPVLSLQNEVSHLRKEIARLGRPSAEADAGRKDRAARGDGQASEGTAKAAEKGRAAKGRAERDQKRGQKRGRAVAVEAAEEARPAEGQAEPGHNGAAEAAAEERPGKHSGARTDKRDRLAARAAEVAALRDVAAARLAEANERLRAIEGAGDGEGSIELERLRRDAAQFGRRVEQLTFRATQFQERLDQLDAGEGKGDRATDTGGDDGASDERAGDPADDE